MKTIKKLTAIFLLLFLITLSAKIFAQTKFRYVATAPINLNGKSNMTIRGDSINGGTAMCLHLTNCSNIHITRCKFQNSKERGIRLDNCTNITIDSCYFTKVADGVYAFKCTGGIKVNYNQFLNMVGPVPRGHAVQYNNCSGGGNTINYNQSEIVNGTGPNPNPEVGDIINLYQSNGIPTDPIRMYGNLLRGGGTATGSMGMAGIVAGDVGGSYQDIENNRLVNTGYVGIQIQGGTHITVKYNQIYSDLLPWSALGLGCANYSGAPCNNNTVAYNQVNWQAGYLNMKRRDTCFKPGTGATLCARPTGWETNIVNAPLKPVAFFPTVLINVARLLPTN
ncbi:MAG TPA: right-handed parallel beta-helix repeat-containing protein [Mucilaginibacter sp.]|nr:right-handed parallel beta-helix repeat-containing protein [Mucilaginibacter sp.]